MPKGLPGNGCTAEIENIDREARERVAECRYEIFAGTAVPAAGSMSGGQQRSGGQIAGPTPGVHLSSTANVPRRGRLRGWYVLEQDTILTEEPSGAGPVEDVHASADHLRTVLDRLH